MWMISCGNRVVCMIWKSVFGKISSSGRPSGLGVLGLVGPHRRMTVFIGWSALPASTASQRMPRALTQSANSRVGPGWLMK